MKKVFALMLTVALLLSGTAAFAIDQHEPGYLEEQTQLLLDNLVSWYEEGWGEGHLVAPYEEPITLRMVNYYTATVEKNMATWNEWWGETLEDNRYTDAIRRALNIDIQYDWLANSADNGYVTKLRLEMAAGNIPDMFLVTNQNDLMQLAESGQIIPVADVIDTYFTTWDKDVINSDGGQLLEMASYEGQVYGIPRTISSTDTFSYIWLREDWMDKVGASVPTTMAELKDLMKAFMEADFDGNGQADTFGMVIDKALYYGTRGLFAGFDAHPEFWLMDGEQIVWGGVQEANKEALAFLNELYVEGYLNPEFVTDSNTDALGDALAGQCGVLYAGHWVAHSLQTLYEQDPESEWICVNLPSLTGEPVDQYLTPNKRGWVVISTECKYPEAAGKISALSSFVVNSGVVSGTFWFSNDNGQELQPFQSHVSSWDNYNTYKNLLECFETGDESVLRAKAITYWGNMSSSSEWAWMRMFGPGPTTPMVVLGDAIDNDRIHFDAYLGAPSMFMQDRWSSIRDEQLNYFTKMIIGEKTIDEGWAEWLNTFDAMGGTTITEEVNAWNAAR